jgi:hypothetical protein
VKGVKGILAKLESCKKRIAAERDKLRDLISELEDIAECCDVAHGDLESAADSLSEYL